MSVWRKQVSAGLYFEIVVAHPGHEQIRTPETVGARADDEKGTIARS
jgi:hypothetical protein